MTTGAALAAALGGAVLLWQELQPVPTQIQAPTSDSRPLPPPVFSSTPAEVLRAMPGLHFRDAQGRDLSLADFRGKVILLNVWATWCIPCRRELPALDRLQAKLGGPTFEVVALSIDREGVAAVKPFFEQVGVKALRVYLDPSTKATQALDVLGLPTTLLIDRMGRERGRVVGPADWDGAPSVETIRRYLTASLGAPGSEHLSLAEVNRSITRD